MINMLRCFVVLLDKVQPQPSVGRLAPQVSIKNLRIFDFGPPPFKRGGLTTITQPG